MRSAAEFDANPAEFDAGAAGFDAGAAGFDAGAAGFDAGAAGFDVGWHACRRKLKALPLIKHAHVAKYVAVADAAKYLGTIG